MALSQVPSLQIEVYPGPVAVVRQLALQLPPLMVFEQLALHSTISVKLNGGCIVQFRTAGAER